MTAQALLVARVGVPLRSPLGGAIAQSLGHGLHSASMTLRRFAVAGLVMLPILAGSLRRDTQSLLVQWGPRLAVFVLTGPSRVIEILGALAAAAPGPSSSFSHEGKP